VVKLCIARQVNSVACLIAILISLLMLSGNAHAFDGHRKGFVLGGGVGFAPVADYQRTEVDVKTTQSSISFDLIIGHGISDRDLLLIDYRLAPYSVKDVPELDVVQGFLGITWHHYFLATNKSLFSSVGLGRVLLATMDLRRSRTPSKLFDDHWNSSGSGWGMTLGLGYQFARRLEISSNWSMGKFALEDSTKTTESLLDVTLTLILF
jgi:hypothetical protein